MPNASEISFRNTLPDRVYSCGAAFCDDPACNTHGLKDADGDLLYWASSAKKAAVLEISVITDANIPEQFQPAALYRAMGSDAGRTLVEQFKHWCEENKVFYYARPRDSFRRWEAEELARAAGCTKLLMEDLS